MKVERNKFLARYIGECYHEFPEHLRYNGVIWPCEHCGDEYLLSQIKGANKGLNFSSYEGLGKLIGYLKDTEVWQKIRWNVTMAEFMDLMTDPDKAADRLYEYLKEKK